MKTFKIFVNPQPHHEAVKQGWSWPGFFFTFIWAFIKKMWVLGIVLLVLFVAFEFANVILSVALKEAAPILNVVFFIIKLPIAIYIGAKGNKWREKKLLARGYEYKDTVQAENPDAAVALWMKVHTQ